MSGSIALCLALMELTGQNESFDKSPFSLFFMFIVPFVVWYQGMKAKRKAQHNHITYKEALLEGMRIALVYALVSPFVFLAYYLLINPGIVAYIRMAYRMDGASDTMVIGIDLLVQFVAALFFGTLYSAFLALFVKNAKKS